MARCGATLNDTLFCKLPRRKCRRNKPSILRGRFFAVRRERTSFYFMRWDHSCETIFAGMKSTAAPVSRRLVDVCTTVVEIPYDIRGLYNGLNVRATSAVAEEKSKD